LLIIFETFFALASIGLPCREVFGLIVRALRKVYHRALLDIGKTNNFKSRSLTSFVKVSALKLAD